MIRKCFSQPVVSFLLLVTFVAAIFVVSVAINGVSNTVSSIKGARAFAANPSFPTVGAIRWDAWNGDAGPDQSSINAGLWAESAISPAQWHYRLPFYTTVSASSTIQVRLDSQAMDQEIAAAKAGGLSYWAFDYYGASSGLTRAFNFYLASAHKSDINFSLILLNGGLTENWPTNVVNLLTDPQYQTVLSGRPLIYVFKYGMPGGSTNSIDVPTWRANFDSLRIAAQVAGLPNPYIIFLSGTTNDTYVNQLGLDAISAYAVSPTGAADQAVPYNNLAVANQAYWDNAKSAGLKVVPPVSTGWDPRPMWDNPPPWGVGTHTAYNSTGTPSEIASNLQFAANWTASNPSVAEANTILVYAWNEFDEGGWLDPLLDTGSERLDAISQVIAGTAGGDTQPPTVFITSPAASSGVSGAVSVSVNASDNIGVVGVQFKLDGVNLSQEITTAPYMFTWDTTTVTNSTHVLTAVARDASLNSTTSVPIVVTVNNPLPVEPVGSWNLNENSGLMANDTSGNGNNGTLTGGASWIQGKRGSGINLNGVDSYITIPDNSNLDGMKAITVSAWVNLSQLPIQNYVVIGKDSSGTSYRITIGSSGKTSFTVNTTNNGWYSAGTNVGAVTTILPNTWKHIVGTYDGNYTRIYVNGTLESTGSQIISGTIVNSASALRFGYKSSANIDYTKGVVDEVSIYSVALSPAEVKTLYDLTDQNADVIAPVVSITEPADFTIVSGVIPISATATDASGISKVEFYADNGLLVTDTTTPYSALWNTAGLVHNSVHALTAKAYDAAGNIGSSTPVSVTVLDITPPSVTITSPANNSTVSRNTNVTITATASDVSGISKVEFYVNSSLKCTDTVSPYTCVWKVPSSKGTSYTLTAKAYDTAGNTATSAAVKVTGN